MEHIGIIDIGSNSVRLILVKMRHNGTFKIIDDIKETIKLGEGMQDTPYLKPDKITNNIPKTSEKIVVWFEFLTQEEGISSSAVI